VYSKWIVKHSKIDEIAINKILDFAKNSTKEVQHQMAMEWNWDNYMEFIEWLINNPESDKATILMIYWKSGPNENYKNRNIIEERYKNNFYKN
jgi:hypothetical protein